jgi:hypothetical protein
MLKKYPNNFVEKLQQDTDEQREQYREIPCIGFSQKIQHHGVTKFVGFIHSDLFTEIEP